MLKKFTSIYLLFICVCSAKSFAQETSMISDVSYTFLDKLVETAKANYPRMRYFDHREKSTAADIKRAQASWLEPLNLYYQYSPNNSTTLVNPSFLNGYQVGLSLNVGSLLQKPSIIRKAKEDHKVTEAERDEFNLNITAMVQQRYFIYVRDLNILKTAGRSVLDAEAAVKQLKYLFEKGQETFERYNQATSTLNNENTRRIEAEANFLIAKSALEELVGKKLEEIK